MQNRFANELDNVSKLSRTANGGVTYAIEAINHPLVRALYCIGSGRDDPNLVVKPFIEALNDESLTDYCVRFALFVRDIGNGAGERTVGRKLLTEIANRNVVDINKIIDNTSTTYTSYIFYKAFSNRLVISDNSKNLHSRRR